MYIEQIYTGCLSEAAYFVESNGESVVIDPMRDTESYLQMAKNHQSSIKYIFETHFHADFVSGHLDLSKQTGATIVYGPHTEAKFPFHLSSDGEIFKIGNITLEVIHTPGHTLESTCSYQRRICSINAKINKEGYHNLDAVKSKGLTPLSIKEFKSKAENGVILDTRRSSEFTNGFIPGSIFIGLEGRFAEWTGSLLSFNESMILVTPDGKEEETVVRLARVGFDKVEGFLNGGVEAWKKAGEKTDLIINIEADELAMDIPFDNHIMVLDVRKYTEFADGHVKDAVNLPLAEMTDVAQIAQLEEDQNIYIHCVSGYRSVIASSLLKRQGYHNLRNVLGGWDKIKEQKNITVEKEAKVLN